MRRVPVLPCLALLVVVAPAAAEDLTLSPTQLDRVTAGAFDFAAAGDFDLALISSDEFRTALTVAGAQALSSSTPGATANAGAGETTDAAGLLANATSFASSSSQGGGGTFASSSAGSFSQVTQVRVFDD